MKDDHTPPPRVYVGPTQPSLVETIERGLEHIEWQTIIPCDARVAIKPNFCWPERLPGVTTSPETLDAVLRIISTRTPHIMVVESDGGTFAAEQAFASHDAAAICARYGAKLVNLSRHPRESRRVQVAGKEIEIEFSSLLLDQVDVLITLPVLKTHVVTTVSLGMKNLWGCIPTSMRLLFHPILGHGIVAQSMLLRPAITIIDATYGLDRRGPVYGDAIPVGKVIVSNNVVAADAAGTRMLGFDPASVEHLRLAAAMQLGPLTVDPSNYAGADDAPVRRFTIKPTPMDRAAIVTYRHFWLSRLVYDSALTRVIYAAFRRTPPSPHVGAHECPTPSHLP